MEYVLTKLPTSQPYLRPLDPYPRYKRYRLSDGKDFSSLFFPEKEALLRVLEHFENKSGRRPPTPWSVIRPGGVVPMPS